ncbi:hypothetical protein ARMGADRAFT_1082642 [Armillaria gallica]|uniref:Uncharacterized protein n=1 Tax=Armillaria gallica TaxID=47427 RepID=A0A2H3D8C7_ARMGA|nr:hypothetical protein ARMGADRAFT_1082642 [Armillaria gallica]
MFQADTDLENDEEAYVDYFQTGKETYLDENYNDDAYAYFEQVSVNAATWDTSETQSHVKDRQNAVATNPYGTQLNPNKNPSNEAQKGTGTWPSKKDNLLPSEPIPVDIQLSQIQDLLELEDINMAEETQPSIIGQTSEMKGTETMTEMKYSMRQLLIQRRYDAEGLMKMVLSMPVTIPIGEFMAYSAKLRKQLIKELQNCTVTLSEMGKADTVKTTLDMAQVNLVTMEPIQTKPLICSALIIIKVAVGNESKKVLTKAIVDLGWLWELIHLHEPELTPVLPVHDIPHPTVLSHSSEYFPLPSNISDTLHDYLRESLYHPTVTDHASFHAAVLTTNHALRLEPAQIRGQKVQRTHAFDAMLAELQGPDGLPIASRLGQAVVIFFPEEYSYECSENECPPSTTGGDHEEIRMPSDEARTDRDDLCDALQSTWRAL